MANSPLFHRLQRAMHLARLSGTRLDLAGAVHLAEMHGAVVEA